MKAIPANALPTPMLGYADNFDFIKNHQRRQIHGEQPLRILTASCARERPSFAKVVLVP
jgi:hypothetical protein